MWVPILASDTTDGHFQHYFFGKNCIIWFGKTKNKRKRVRGLAHSNEIRQNSVWRHFEEKISLWDRELRSLWRDGKRGLYVLNSWRDMDIDKSTLNNWKWFRLPQNLRNSFIQKRGLRETQGFGIYLKSHPVWHDF